MMSSGRSAWMASGVATLASIYALDTISTGAGALLVASGLLHGVGLGAAMALLLASYALWGLALRPSLGANWELLQQTGASTCLPSKMVHDFAIRHGASLRTQRIATAGGYVATELVKEAPYYLGVAGVALLADGVTSADAIIFLGGANLGAATYEYGLARAVRKFLGRASATRYASFEADWDPRRYLADYYRAVEPDERETIAYLVEAARELPPNQSVLVFGAGPTLHHLFPFVPCARVIDLSDLLPANLREIERWIDGDATAHDWRPFVQHALACEGGTSNEAGIDRREDQARDRIGRLLQSDLRRAPPLSTAPPGYDVVVSTYCADSATDDIATWELYLQRIAALVRPGGLLVVAALRRCRGYRVGSLTFPSANVDETDMRRVLAPLAPHLQVEVRRLPKQVRHGYEGILLARGRTRPKCRLAEMDVVNCARAIAVRQQASTDENSRINEAPGLSHHRRPEVRHQQPASLSGATSRHRAGEGEGGALF